MGHTPVYVAKVSPTGQWLWATTGTLPAPAPTRPGSRGLDVALDPRGGVQVLLAYTGGLTLGALTLPTPPEPLMPALAVARISDAGQWLSAAAVTSTAYPGSFPFGQGQAPLTGAALAVDAQGTAYVAGSGGGDLLFPALPTMPSPNAMDAIPFVASLSPAGVWQWATRVGLPTENVSPGRLAVLPTSGEVAVAAHFKAAFGSGEAVPMPTLPVWARARSARVVAGRASASARARACSAGPSISVSGVRSS